MAAAELAEEQARAGVAYRHHQEVLHVCRSYSEKATAIRDAQLLELTQIAADVPNWPGLTARVEALRQTLAGVVPMDMPAPTVTAGYGYQPDRAAAFQQALDARGPPAGPPVFGVRWRKIPIRRE